MSIRQNIMDELSSLFNLISVSNGYSFDIDGQVHEWRTTPFKDEDLPAIVFRDTDDMILDGDPKIHELTVEVVLFSAAGQSPAWLRPKLADILQAFKQLCIRPQPVPEVEGAAYIRSELDTEHIQKKYAAALIIFSVVYSADEWET